MTQTTPRIIPTWILRALVMGGIALCVPAALGGAFLLLVDARDTSEELHGLGIFLGGLLLAAALVAMLVQGVVLLMLFRWPRAGLVVTGVLAALALLGFTYVLSQSIDQWPSFLVCGGCAAGVLALVAWALVPVRADTGAMDAGRIPGRP